MANKAKTKQYVGEQMFVSAGTRYKRFGSEKKALGRTVTIRSQEHDKRSGKTRVYWKSMGYRASTLV